MKKNLIILAALFLTQLAMAKDRVIVIIGNEPTNIGNTKVKVDSNVYTDTLTITPAKDVSFIYVTLRDASDNIVESYCSPAYYNDCFTIISPTLPYGYTLEIKDDKGAVYREER